MRLALSIVLALTGATAFAQDKDDVAENALKQCELSAKLIGEVRQARLDRVRKAKAAEKVLAADTDWPETVSQALPTVVEYVYSIPRRELKAQDLGEITRVQCLQQYEQAQSLTNTASD